PSNTLTDIVSLPPITLPVLPAGSSGGWRIIVTYTLAVKLAPNGGRVTACVTDETNVFASASQNFIENTDFITGIDISPFYVGGTVVTLTLQQSNGKAEINIT